MNDDEMMEFELLQQQVDQLTTQVNVLNAALLLLSQKTGEDPRELFEAARSVVRIQRTTDLLNGPDDIPAG